MGVGCSKRRRCVGAVPDWAGEVFMQLLAIWFQTLHEAQRKMAVSYIHS